MRFARIIGRVTLSVFDPAYAGGRFLIGIPCKPDQGVIGPGSQLPKGNSLVIFDQLGATTNDLIGYTDGGEAAAPFSSPTPCDAFNAAILDTVFWEPANP